MRYASKRDLVDAIVRHHEDFVEMVRKVPAARHEEAGVWGDGWTIKDLVAHLVEWHRLFLGWHRDGAPMPAPGYTWKDTPRLNRDIQRKHAGRSMKAVLSDFEKSHAEVLSVARSLPPQDLLKPGRFAWTGKLPLVSYLGANSASHYRTASGYIKRWLRKSRPSQPHH